MRKALLTLSATALVVASAGTAVVAQDMSGEEDRRRTAR